MFLPVTILYNKFITRYCLGELFSFFYYLLTFYKRLFNFYKYVVKYTRVKGEDNSVKILAFDTSNKTLTVSLMEDTLLLGEITTNVNKNHSVTLMPAIADLMEKVGLTPQDIDRIVVAQGPGSYTGLRIGVTTAKTLADTLNCELVGVSSLAVLAANCRNYNGVIVPLFDARRNNVYTGLYKWQENELQTVKNDTHIALTDLLPQLAFEKEILFVGEDVIKFSDQIKTALPHATINQVPHWQVPNGAVLAELGAKKAPVLEIDAFLPLYLKRVEAEEKWIASHQDWTGDENYVEKI